MNLIKNFYYIIETKNYNNLKNFRKAVVIFLITTKVSLFIQWNLIIFNDLEYVKY